MIWLILLLMNTKLCFIPVMKKPFDFNTLLLISIYSRWRVDFVSYVARCSEMVMIITGGMVFIAAFFYP